MRIPLYFTGPDIKCGRGLYIYPYSTIEDDVVIGDNCVIGSNVFVGRGSRIGDGTRIQHGAFICRGAKIGCNVFVGPLAVLTDDKYPRVHQPGEPAYNAQPPTLEDGCSIGAGAVILANVTIGAGSMVGAGAVVIDNVQAGQTVVKVPAVVLASTQDNPLVHVVEFEAYHKSNLTASKKCGELPHIKDLIHDKDGKTIAYHD